MAWSDLASVGRPDGGVEPGPARDVARGRKPGGPAGSRENLEPRVVTPRVVTGAETQGGGTWEEGVRFEPVSQGPVFLHFIPTTVLR